jgi:hypothetical protein
MGADTVTQGPPPASQVVGTEGLILDATNNVLYTFGQNQELATLQSALASLGPQTALTAITTAQTLLSRVFGPGSLNVVGRTFKVSGTLIYATTSANVATITIAVKLGTVTLATVTTAATNTAASTNLPVTFSFTFTVVSTGAAATLYASGNVNADLGTTAAAAITSYLLAGSAVSSAVNLLTAETLAVTIAASAALPSAQLMNAVIELVA